MTEKPEKRSCFFLKMDPQRSGSTFFLNSQKMPTNGRASSSSQQIPLDVLPLKMDHEGQFKMRHAQLDG